MKSTGIVRRVDDLGRVVIPKELRQTLGIKEGDPLEIYTDGKKIVFSKYQPGCQVSGCGALDDLCTMGNVTMCVNCIGKFAIEGRKHVTERDRFVTK